MSLGIMHQLPEFVRGHQLAAIVKDAQEDDYESAHVATEQLQDAHVITSKSKNDVGHRPVLDIDFPAALIPSTTPGHFHLYLDKPMPWGKYKALLKALADAGIIERGYASASIARQYTSVRLPWVPQGSRQAVNVPTSTREIWLNPAGDNALTMSDLDYLETAASNINGSRNSVTKLSGTLPKGGGNGLESLNRDLVRDPQRTHLIVAVVDCSQITTDVDTGDEVATARIRRIEPIDPQDKDHAVRILRRAMERRTGDTLLPIEMEDELTALLKLLDPETGELLEPEAPKDSTGTMPWDKDTDGDAGSDQ